MNNPISRDRENNFGFLRLLFATLVILSHSPEMVDGNRSREILTRLFGTLSFGEVGVDSFFLVSGYLITLSLVQSKSNLEYLLKRVLRIYPGYIAAFLFSLFIVGPLAGGTNADLRSMVLNSKLIEHLLLLDKPELKSAFQNLPKPYLSGTMWSLAYEFRCYIVLMILGAVGVLRQRKLVLAITVLLLQALVVAHINYGFIAQHTPIASPLIHFFGDPIGNVRCYTCFFCGSCFFLFSDKIVYHSRIAIIAAAVLFNLMFAYQLAEAAFAVLGGYILFWFALSFKSAFLGRVGSRNDLSYGIYLYAWPIQNLLIWHFRHISPWLLFVIALPVSGVFAFGSWVCVERPFIRLKGRLRFTNKNLALATIPSNP